MKLEDLEVPDEDFNPVTGDHKATSALLKKRNKQERAGQESLFVTALKSHEDLDRWLVERTRFVEAMPEDNATEVQAKAEAYQKVNESNEFRTQRQIADLWTAAFFWNIEEPTGKSLEIVAPTHGQLRRLRSGGQTQLGLLDQVEKLSRTEEFFHWPLEFAEVAVQGGFDCVLGNPPWDMVQLDPQEFFIVYAPKIANALNLSIRESLIEKLKSEDIDLYLHYQNCLHNMEAQQRFIHESKNFPFTSYGRINLMSLFAELDSALLSKTGMSGIVIPTGIATDSFNQFFFHNLIKNKQLFKLIGFENEEFLFPAIANVVRFCLFVTSGVGHEEENPIFAFFIRRLTQLQEKERFFELSAQDLELLNPNTGTCPIFRNKTDATLTKYIYHHVPILLNEKRNENFWGYKGLLMFMMNTDSNLFSLKQKDGYLPLYEGKLIWHYDHRYASYDLKGIVKGKGGRGLPDTPLSRYQDLNYVIEPQYWVPESEVLRRVPQFWKWNWLMAFRKVASAKVERTSIFAIIPKVGVGHNAPLLFLSKIAPPQLASCFIANANSLVFDYVARQKVGGTDINFYILNQLPFLPPSTYSTDDINYISKRVVELVYTAFDIKPFAEDMGYQGEPFRWDEERRALLRAELDAYFARLYGLNHKQLRYILDPADLTPRELENILDSWEEVTDPLDPVGYAQRVAASDFPGETFRVLKEKEIKQYSEYRTRRLVLEAWDRLEGVDVGNPDSYQEHGTAVPLKQETITVAQPRPERRPAVVQTQLPATAKPPLPVTPPSKVVKEIDPPADQPTLSDFGLYKCEVCGKMVMGFEKANHEREIHGGKSVEWKKMR